MLSLPNILLFVISVFFFLIGFAFLTDKAGKILLWSITGKMDRIRDLAGYKRQQGKFSIAMGMIFLMFPFAFHLFKVYDVKMEYLRIWYVLILGTTLYNGFRSRRYFT